MNIIKKTIFIIIIIVSVFYFFVDWDFITKKESLHIAVVAPLSGKYKSAGKDIVNGVSLYINEVNQKFPIDDKKIVLDIFDDENNPEKAEKIAHKISNNKNIYAVIGHYYSSCSISAGKIYKKNQIPAITPASTNINVTKDNIWYFRNLYNDDVQSRFLATYINKVFPDENVSIIYEENEYGRNIFKEFNKTAGYLGINIKYIWNFHTNDKRVEEKLRRIVFDMQFKKDAGIIFLACHASNGIDLIKLMRDNLVKNRIVGTDSLTSKIFQKQIEFFQKEHNNPGFYTNGMLVSTPIIFDTINEKGQLFKNDYKKQYNEDPGWHSAFSYDTAMLLVKALRYSKIDGKKESIMQDRKRIRDYLASINNIEDSIYGVTGYNYFDKNRNATKTVFTGIYRSNNIISTSIQFQPVPNIFAVSDFTKAVKEKRIMLFDGRYMYKINIVYTGFEIKEIQDIDMQDRTFIMDFFLWFRFNGNINPENIQFINSVGSIELEKPVSTEVKGDMTYQLYHIKGKFKMDFIPKLHAFNEHILGISFRHNELTRDNLIYVTDILGMGLTRGKSYTQRLNESHVISPTFGWGITDCWFFQSIAARTPMGEFKHINSNNERIKYSKFNLGIRINKKELKINKFFHINYAKQLFLITFFTLIYFSFIINKSILDRYLRIIWFFQALLSFIFLITFESLLDSHFSNKLEPYQVNIIEKLIDILWWVIPAILICAAVKRFIWIPLEIKTERRIPDIVVNSVNFIMYVLTFFGIIAFIFDQKITSLLATSGVFAMIIGLAVQINISNIFSGIALNIESPFKIGHWVKIGDFDEGKVVDITWRAVRLLSRDDSIISIPNSTVSESSIHNYHYPNDIYRYWFKIHIDSKFSPDIVKQILLEAALKADYVLENPPPLCRFLGLTEWSATYLVSFSLKDYADKIPSCEAVWKEVWYHLSEAKIELAVPRHDVQIFKGIYPEDNNFIKQIDLKA